MENEFKFVADETEVPEGKMKTAMLGKKPILIYRQNGKLYALSNVCTHMGGRMSDGMIIGHERDRLVCPRHKAVFSLCDGSSHSFPRRGLESHETKVENGKVYVSIRGSVKWREPYPHSVSLN